MDNVTQLNEKRDAEAAKRILSEPILVESVKAVEAQYLETMLNLKDTDDEGIKACRQGIKSLRLILQHLHKQVMNGELTSYELDQAKGKRPRSFF